VGVYLRQTDIDRDIDSFPHARGGVPSSLDIVIMLHQFSPRTWGCTSNTYSVINGHLSFSHARGGVPDKELPKEQK